jgi:hypothetical protein
MQPKVPLVQEQNFGKVLLMAYDVGQYKTEGNNLTQDLHHKHMKDI